MANGLCSWTVALKETTASPLMHFTRIVLHSVAKSEHIKAWLYCFVWLKSPGLKHCFEIFAARHEDVAMKEKASTITSHCDIWEALWTILLACQDWYDQNVKDSSIFKYCLSMFARGRVAKSQTMASSASDDCMGFARLKSQSPTKRYMCCFCFR